jgi:hypothetical protein
LAAIFSTSLLRFLIAFFISLATAIACCAEKLKKGKWVGSLN